MSSKDIVHRDLKPQNILLSHSGHGGRNKFPPPQDIKLKIGKELTKAQQMVVFCGIAFDDFPSTFQLILGLPASWATG